MTDFSAWDYVATYSQPGSSEGTLVNNYVTITVAYQSYMNADFSDIRFTLSDGTLLSHNRVSYTASSTATFHVLIPSLPTAGITLTVYAGNSSAPDIFNPSSVYTSFFDDFADLSNWTTDSGSPSVASSILTVPSNSKIHKTVTNTRPLKIIVKAKISGIVTNAYWISPLNFYASSKGTDYGIRFATVSNICQIESYGGSDSTQSIPNFADNTYHTFELRLKGADVADFYIDGTLVGEITTNIYSTVNTLGFLNNSGSNQTLSVDWASMAPYTTNPPAAGTLGSWEVNVVQIKSTLTVLQLSEDLKSTLTVLQCSNLKNTICIRQLNNDLKNTVTVTALTSNGLKSTLLIPSPFSIEQNTRLQSTITITAPPNGTSLKSSITVLGIYSITMTLRATVLRTDAILDGLNEQSPSLVVNIGGDLYV